MSRMSPRLAVRRPDAKRLLLVLIGSLLCTAGHAAVHIGPSILNDVTVVSAKAASGVFASPESLVDGDKATEFTFEWGNGGASVTFDLGQPCAIVAVEVTNGQTNRVVFLSEIAVGPDPDHLRDLLGRRINLPVWRGGDSELIHLQPSAGRFARVSFTAGGQKAAISEVVFHATRNLPERHLMCWSANVKSDFLDKIDYLDRELAVTDLWLDYVGTAFPQGNHNSGFQVWIDTGALREFAKRRIRYWLGEHEAFTTMVNCPEDLRDDLRWETTVRQVRHVYAQARELGFRGVVMDAEDYGGVTPAAREKYKDVADYVDAWCFADEFGYGGSYYQRGLQYGRAMKEVWDCPLMQVYEARMYAGKNDCRAGNYWWLKGIHDAGVDIWIATEKTYGAGDGEMADASGLGHLTRWFVKMPQFVPDVHKAYPFASRVLPGFHPWNNNTGKPHYLPKYLDEQLKIAENCVLGYWIYNEGNHKAGDPRDFIDRDYCNRYGVAPEDYLAVFSRHPTSRSRQ